MLPSNLIKNYYNLLSSPILQNSTELINCFSHSLTQCRSYKGTKDKLCLRPVRDVKRPDSVSPETNQVTTYSLRCDVCDYVIPDVSDNKVFHSNRPLPGCSGGYDMCLYCYVNKFKQRPNGCLGIHHWLAINPTCPTCRAPVDKNYMAKF